MLLGPLAATLLENLSRAKGVKVKIPRWGVKRAGEGIINTDQDF